MDHIQRFFAAVHGRPVDRVPVVAWMHLATEMVTVDEAASRHELLYQLGNWDLLKLMADFRWEVSGEAWSFETPQQVASLNRPSLMKASFHKQEALAALVQSRLGREVPVMDSGYDPLQMLLRHVGRDQLSHLWANKELTQSILECLCELTCRHVKKLKQMGISAYFHSTHGAIPEGRLRGMPQRVFDAWVRPFDLAVLQAAQGMVRVLHAHGSHLNLSRLSDYPYEVLSIADHAAGNPGLGALRKWTGACLMGGIDETAFTSQSLGALAQQMGQAVADAGHRKLILAPGCVIPASSSVRSLRFLNRWSEMQDLDLHIRE